MTLAASPTLDTVATKLGNLLLDAVIGVVPAGTPVLRGPINRAAQPPVDHVVFTILDRHRLRQNVETDVDPFPSAGGETQTEQGIKLMVQVDFYGRTAANWVDPFTTVWHSEKAFRYLAPECAPLYADDGRMIPLTTGEEQFLERWAVTAMLQYNPVTSVPQQFADTLSANVINVDERYPPS
jgi:hypothetical protein